MSLSRLVNTWVDNLDYWLQGKDDIQPSHNPKTASPMSASVYDVAYNRGRRDAYKEVMDIISKSGLY